jgi:hypothetical protein
LDSQTLADIPDSIPRTVYFDITDGWATIEALLHFRTMRRFSVRIRMARRFVAKHLLPGKTEDWDAIGPSGAVFRTPWNMERAYEPLRPSRR